MTKLSYSFVDRLIIETDLGIRTLFSRVHPCRQNPAELFPEGKLSAQEKKRTAGFLRVDHTGEICAQALYRGQGVFTQSEHVQSFLREACEEEKDHLAWTSERLVELGARPSFFNVYWYMHSFFLGAFVSLFGDAWNLGFVEETEKQVGKHLESHLVKIPKQDKKSRAILVQMQEDELKHGSVAQSRGARSLPYVIRKLMQLQSKVMTTLAFYI